MHAHAHNLLCLYYYLYVISRAVTIPNLVFQSNLKISIHVIIYIFQTY